MSTELRPEDVIRLTIASSPFVLEGEEAALAALDSLAALAALDSLVADLHRVTRERDAYRETLRRIGNHGNAARGSWAMNLAADVLLRFPAARPLREEPQ